MADDLIERLERARTDFWAHTRMDCLREAADALASKDKALEEMRAELAARDAHRLENDAILLATIRRAEAAESGLERARKALEPFYRADKALSHNHLQAHVADDDMMHIRAGDVRAASDAYQGRAAARAQAEGQTP